MNINIQKIYEWPAILKIPVFLIISIMVFYALYLWDISNLMSQLMSAKQKEKSIQQQIESTFSKEVALKKETQQFPKIEATLNTWQNKLITYQQFPRLLNEILKLGSTNHLSFTLFSPAKEIKLNQYFNIPIKVTAIGDYHDVSHFLSDIANLSFHIVIGNFSITQEDKKNDLTSQLATSENSLTAEILLEVYYLATPKK